MLSNLILIKHTFSKYHIAEVNDHRVLGNAWNLLMGLRCHLVFI